MRNIVFAAVMLLLALSARGAVIAGDGPWNDGRNALGVSVLTVCDDCGGQGPSRDECMAIACPAPSVIVSDIHTTLSTRAGTQSVGRDDSPPVIHCRPDPYPPKA